MYQTGQAGRDERDTQSSNDEAFNWYQKAAHSGSVAGELNLGLAYFNGTGVPQDLGEAVKWFVKAAAHGSAAACDQLGRVYQHGWGAPRDYSLADRWYHMAIERGYAQAKQDLASLNEVAHQAASAVGAVRPDP
jgi:TPR repeat protein